MESAIYQNPKDEHITNDDIAVTNKDGDNDLEKGPVTGQQKIADKPIRPDNNSAFIELPATEHTANKGEEPAGENL